MSPLGRADMNKKTLAVIGAILALSGCGVEAKDLNVYGIDPDAPPTYPSGAWHIANCKGDEPTEDMNPRCFAGSTYEEIAKWDRKQELAAMTPAERKAAIKADKNAEEEWQKEMDALEKDIEERERNPEAYWKKRRIEMWGYDPGPGGINDGGGSGIGGCVYDPTMNYDWHDDMVCGGVRQYFLPDQEYVTRDDLEWAAREWEASN